MKNNIKNKMFTDDDHKRIFVFDNHYAGGATKETSKKYFSALVPIRVNKKK